MDAIESNLIIDIQKKVEEMLPGMHAGALKKFIDQALRDAKELVEAREYLRLQREECQRLGAELDKLRRLNMSEHQIQLDKASLELEKRNFEIDKKLQVQDRDNANQKVDLVKELFNTVFRNVEVRKTVFENKNHIMPGTNGYPTNHPVQDNSNSTEVKG